jgi:Fe-S-cluster containining protein
MLADLVSSMPEPRRHLMRRRFAATGTAIDAHFPRHAPLTGLADEYFALGIACPFLEDEACSIHPDRPSICREYMVTTPAERCNSLNSPYAGIEFVPLPLRISEGLAQVAAIAMETAPMSIALTSALAWARENSVDGRRTWDSRILLAWTEAAFARSATG